MLFSNDDILTVEEVAKVLKVSKRTVYRWVEDGDLKTAKIGRKTYRVFESELKRFIKSYIK